MEPPWCSICNPLEMPLPTTAPAPSCTSVDYSHLWEKLPGKRRERGSHVPAAFWKASMAWLRPGREARSCRAPIWVCSAPRLKRTLPFSKARALWWDGTPVRESYLEKGRANSCPSGGGHGPQSAPVMVHKVPSLMERGLELGDLEGPFQPKPPHDPHGCRRSLKGFQCSRWACRHRSHHGTSHGTCVSPSLTK